MRASDLGGSVAITGAVTAPVRQVREVCRRPVVGYPVSAVVVVLVSAVSVVLRRRVQSRLGLSPYDTMLYIDQARSLDAHDWLGGYTNLTLVKVPGYSLFVSLCDRLGVGVKDAEQVLVCVAALLVGVCVLVTTRRLAWAVPVFVVGALDPIFLSSWAADYGRDALFASISVVVVVALFLTGYFLVVGRAVGWAVVFAGVSGLALAAYLLTREEGLTVLPVAVVALGAVPVWQAVRTRRWRAGWRG